jgi:Alpha amylase inhibitor
VKALKASAAVFFLAMGAGLMLAAPANASEAVAGGDPVAEQVQPQGAPAPNCVKTWYNTGNITVTGYAKNNCHSSYRLKIIWANQTDGECLTVKPGQTLKDTIGVGPGRFDGVQRC